MCATSDDSWRLAGIMLYLPHSQALFNVQIQKTEKVDGNHISVTQKPTYWTVYDDYSSGRTASPSDTDRHQHSKNSDPKNLLYDVWMTLNHLQNQTLQTFLAVAF